MRKLRLSEITLLADSHSTGGPSSRRKLCAQTPKRNLFPKWGEKWWEWWKRLHKEEGPGKRPLTRTTCRGPDPAGKSRPHGRAETRSWSDVAGPGGTCSRHSEWRWGAGARGFRGGGCSGGHHPLGQMCANAGSWSYRGSLDGRVGGCQGTRVHMNEHPETLDLRQEPEDWVTGNQAGKSVRFNIASSVFKIYRRCSLC